MVTPLCIYIHFHFIIVAGRRTKSHSNLLLSLPQKWPRPLCAWSHERNKRKSRRSSSSACVGWVPSTAVQQLLTLLLLLPFTTPRQWLPNGRYESSKERGSQPYPSWRSLPLPDQHQGQVMIWSCNMYVPVPFSGAVNEFFLQDPDACNAGVSIWPVNSPITVNVKT